MEPVVFDNFSTGHRSFVDATVPGVEGDLRDPAALDRAFREYPIDGVIHFAGLALVAESVRDPALYFETNVVGGLNLLNAMRRAGVGRLIFSSTCATYGVPETSLIAESHPQRPVNPYGESKLAFERALEAFGLAYGISFLSLRYFNAAGADAASRRGEDHNPETHLIPLTLAAAAGVRPEVRIFGTDYPTPDGTCVRDYIHVTDLANAHVKGLAKLFEGTVESQAINLGTGEGISVRDLIEVARRVTGKSFRAVESERRPGDPPRLVADPTRSGSVLGWRPVHSGIEEIVESAWRWSAQRQGSRG
jgi:UDP-glucose 4-epimerase